MAVPFLEFTASANRQFEFHKFFICVHNDTLSVSAMRVNRLMLSTVPAFKLQGA